MPWLETAARDFRYAARGLAQNPAFTAAAVFSLALGIGANTAVFSMYHSLMLRLLPVSNPGELVNLDRTGGWGRGFTSYPLYLEIRKCGDLFQGVIARSGMNQVRFRAGAPDRMETVQREYASGNYFAVLGVGATLGHLFTEADDRTPHAHPVAVLTFDFWNSRFAPSAVLGRILIVDGQPLTVIGVAARGFRGVEVEHHPDLWVPTMMSKGDIMEPGMNWVYLLARRRPDVPRRQVQAAIDVVLISARAPKSSFRFGITMGSTRIARLLLVLSSLH